MTAARIPLYLDTDLGIDDALALAYLLASPEIDLVGVGAVSGNAHAHQVARNVLDLLDLAGRSDIPVALGRTDPLDGPFDGGSPEVHGANGIGGVSLPRSPRSPVDRSAMELLSALAREHRGRLRVLTVGPLSTIGAALAQDSELPALVERVVLMGGAALAPGNITPVAEANIYHDVTAATAVLAADWEIVMVPLDVTMNHRLDDTDQRTLLESGRPVAVAIGGMLEHYLHFHIEVFGRRCMPLHDPTAAAIACGAMGIAESARVRVVVDTTDGPGRGQTVADLRGRYRGFPAQPGANCEIVLELAEPVAPQLIRAVVAV